MNNSSLTQEKNNFFFFVCLIKNPTSSLILGSAINQIKLKHNIVFVNNLVNIDINNIYNFG